MKPADLQPLPDSADYTRHLTTLVERVNGFVYHGSNLDTVIKTVKVLRADPDLTRHLLTEETP